MSNDLFLDFHQSLIMTDQWQDDDEVTAQVRGDDDDAPDDWETALEDKVC